MNEILSIQQMLNKLGSNLTEDGSLGPMTVSEIKQFQLKNSILPDGRISSDLINELKKQTSDESGVSIFTSTKNFLVKNQMQLIILSSASILIGGVWYFNKYILPKKRH